MPLMVSRSLSLYPMLRKENIVDTNRTVKLWTLEKCRNKIYGAKVHLSVVFEKTYEKSGRTE